jgi:hypothetical protein
MLGLHAQGQNRWGVALANSEFTIHVTNQIKIESPGAFREACESSGADREEILTRLADFFSFS